MSVLNIIGETRNNETIDGRGATLTGKDCLLVSSIREGCCWKVPKNITIKNFNIKGSVRLMGMGINGQEGFMGISSINQNHTSLCQEAAPTKITFDNIRIEANERIPFYIAPGCTRITLQNSELTGHSVATAIYLDCESAWNTIENNVIRTTTKRESIAVDGSAFNTIRGNTFDFCEYGGIYLYRNSGEGGVVRHQPPKHNLIEKNTFNYKKNLLGKIMRLAFPAVWVGSRSHFMQYFYSYRNDDKGYNFGSSINNNDLARDNKVRANKPRGLIIRVWET
jgi:parallel beta-helix repeat protein